MKKILLATAISMSLAGAAHAETAIGVGQPGRGYEAFGKDMVERLVGKMPARIANYEGSDAISRAVCDGEVQVGIMQIDAIYARQKEGCSLRVVGTYGTEYAYMLVPPGSSIDELHDLSAGSKVLVDTVGSGTDLFWNTIVSIETGPQGNKSGWAQATSINDPVFLAPSMADLGEVDAVMVVGTTKSKDVKELVDAGWELVAIDDKDINDEMFNGNSLYPREDAEIDGTGGWLSGNASNTSYAIRSFVVVGSELAADRRAFADVAQAAKAASAAKK